LEPLQNFKAAFELGSVKDTGGIKEGRSSLDFDERISQLSKVSRHGSALLEIELQAEQSLGRIVFLLLEYGSIQKAVRFLDFFRYCMDQVLNFKKVKFSEGQPFR
jgi:hypothetical protein